MLGAKTAVWDCAENAHPLVDDCLDARKLDHQRAMIHRVGIVDIAHLAEHALVHDTVQPAQSALLDLVPGDGGIRLVRRRELAGQAASHAGILRHGRPDSRCRGPCDRQGIETELVDHAHAVANQPFAVDAVADDHAIGDAADGVFPARRRAVGAGLGVAPGGRDQV